MGQEAHEWGDEFDRHVAGKEVRVSPPFFLYMCVPVCVVSYVCGGDRWMEWMGKGNQERDRRRLGSDDHTTTT